MDRKINLPTTASLFPAANGWHLLVTGDGQRRAQQAATFAEAVELLPSPTPGETIRVALPTRLAVFERFTLPSHDPAELEGMVQHQLEKTLPYPIEETTHGFEVLSRRDADPEAERGAESTLIAGAVHRAAMETLCAPLLTKNRHPSEVTFRALHAAAQAPDAASCGVWMEENDVVFGIFEEGVLCFAEIADSPARLQENFSQMLLSAELASASTRFEALLLDPALDEFRAPLAKLAGVPERAVIELCTEPRERGGDGSPFPNLAPEAWRLERARQARTRRFKQQCVKVGLAYAACIILAFVYLGLQGSKLRAVERELEATRPQVDNLVTAQARWRALAPAIDQRRFTVELLNNVFESLPSGDTRVTQFNQGKSDFMVQGEAPNAAEAIALVEKLKSVEGLNEYHLEAGQPILLPPNDHAQFSISGKL